MPQFNPLNERLKKQYEETLLHGKHLHERTVMGIWKAITQFEKATGRIAFDTVKAEHAKSFKAWLTKQQNDKGQPLSLSTQRSTVAAVREFFMWLRLHPKYGRRIDGRVAEYLYLSNNDNRAARASKPRKVPTIENMVQAISAMPSQTVWEQRDRAVMALAAITAARDAALISLRLGDVDVENRSVWQDPMHVKTKFRKGIVTAFVPIAPELETIVLEWVGYLRGLGHGDDAPLFPMDNVRQNPETLCFERTGLAVKGWNNASAVRRIFKEAFERVELPYFNPHTCRHMLTGWGMDNLSQIEFKALSQNLGHEHAMTTYNNYGALPVEKQLKLVRGMGQREVSFAGVSDDMLWEELRRRKG